MQMLKFVALAFTAALALLAPHAGQAQPAKPVRLVVPSPAGGATDALARQLGERLSSVWGQPVIVENKAGANQTLGTDAVAKSPADGSTLLVFESAAMTIAPHLYRKLPYDPATDFTLITELGALAPVIAVHPSVPARNLAEFIALAKAQPGTLTFGSFGNGSYAHVAMEQFKRDTGAELTHVPYKGSAPALNDLLGGQISAMLVTVNVVDASAKAGKLRLLASATPKRLPSHPDLPTAAEAGAPGFEVKTWFGLAAPKGLPPALLNRIYADVAAILADPQFRAQALTAAGLQPVTLAPKDFPAQLRAETAAWGAAVKAANVTLE